MATECQVRRQTDDGRRLADATLLVGAGDDLSHLSPMPFASHWLDSTSNAPAVRSGTTWRRSIRASRAMWSTCCLVGPVAHRGGEGDERPCASGAKDDVPRGTPLPGVSVVDVDPSGAAEAPQPRICPTAGSQRGARGMVDGEGSGLRYTRRLGGSEREETTGPSHQPWT